MYTCCAHQDQWKPMGCWEKAQNVLRGSYLTTLPRCVPLSILLSSLIGPPHQCTTLSSKMTQRCPKNRKEAPDFGLVCQKLWHCIFAEMLGTPGLPTAKPVLEQIEAYPWHIDTKYYTADINICTTPTRTIGNEEFAENVQGFVLYFDASEVGAPLSFLLVTFRWVRFCFVSLS